MKVILPGYKKSQHIIPASSWLLNKYLPKDFDVYWLNYGKFDGPVYTGQYVEQDYRQLGGKGAWSMYLMQFLNTIDDEYVILGLDDYFISGPLKEDMYKLLLDNMGGDVVCGRMSKSGFYKNKERKGHLYTLGRNKYNCTAQWCIWNLKILKSILKEITTSWEFEITGTTMLNNRDYRVIGTTPHALPYSDHSALSDKWSGIRTDGLKKEDIGQLTGRGYLSVIRFND